MQGDIGVSPHPDANVGWKNHGCSFSAMEKIVFVDHLLRKTTIGGNVYASELTGKTSESDTGCFGPSDDTVKTKVLWATASCMTRRMLHLHGK
jgi:hypothetical protein